MYRKQPANWAKLHTQSLLRITSITRRELIRTKIAGKIRWQLIKMLPTINIMDKLNRVRIILMMTMMARTIMTIRRAGLVSVFTNLLLQTKIFPHHRKFRPETPMKGQIITFTPRKARMKKWCRIMKMTCPIKIANCDELKEHGLTVSDLPLSINSFIL